MPRKAPSVVFSMIKLETESGTFLFQIFAQTSYLGACLPL